MTIHIATDHAGFALKNEIVAWLRDEGKTVIDHGACTHDPEDDFPDFIALAAAAVSAAPQKNRAIIFGGSGQGEAMLANRYAAVRTAVYYGGNDSIPVLSRQHNDANILCLGARENIKEIGFLPGDEPYPVIFAWIKIFANTEFEGNRHKRRIEKIIEKEGL